MAITTMTTTEARASLADILDRVGRGDEVTITRRGRPVAVVVAPDALRVRRLAEASVLADQVQRILVSGRRARLSDQAGLTSAAADELVQAVRADRDGVDPVDAFDADVLIYASVPGHPLGSRVVALLPEEPPDPSDDDPPDLVGSLVLLPEVLTKPLRTGRDDEAAALGAILGRLHLVPVNDAIAQLAVALGTRHGLKAVDALHLATAAWAGADRFITNNRRDFPTTISEVDVTYPDNLPDVDATGAGGEGAGH